MKKSIFTFFILFILMCCLSSCFTSKKGGCDCFGMSEKNQLKLFKNLSYEA